MPRNTLTTARTDAGRRYTPRNAKNCLTNNLAPGQANFGNIELSGNGGLTFSFFQWVKFSPLAPASRATASKFNFGTNNRSWAITSPNGQLLFIVSGNGFSSQWKRYQTYRYFNDNKWHPIGFVWNNGTLTLCADLDFGVANYILDNASFTTIHQGNANVCLGALTTGGAFVNGWIGQLGPAVASEEALTEKDWLDFVYDGVSPSGLTLEVLMTEGSGSTVADTSGNGYAGTIGGNMTWAEDGPFFISNPITQARQIIS